MEDKTILAMFAIAALVALEIAALTYGHNGVVLSMIIMIIAGLAGYHYKGHIVKK